MWRGFGLLLLLLVLSGCSFTEDTVEPPSELTDIERGARLDVVWSADTGWGETEKWVALKPAVVGDTIYAANIAGQVNAFARKSGEVRWRVELDARLTAGVGGGEDSVYVGTAEGVVIALATEDGRVRWRTDVTGGLLAPPVVADEAVIVRTVDGRVIALDPGDGERLWTHDVDVPALSLRGNGTPLAVPGGVLVGLADGTLVALTMEGGRPAWRTTIAEPTGRSAVQRMVDVDGAVDVTRNAVYAVTYDGKVAKIDPTRGRVLWSREISSYAGLHTDGQRIYVTTADGHVVALDPATGFTLWRQEKLAYRRLTAPVPIPNTPYLVVGDLEGYVHILTRADGRIVNRRDIGGHRILADPVPVAAGRVAVQTRGDTLTVLEVSTLDR